MFTQEKVLPASKYKESSIVAKYEALLHVEGKQPKHLDKVFARLMEQQKIEVSPYTNRFLDAQAEHAYQVWTAAYYASTARFMLCCVLCFHLILVFLDSLVFSPSSYLVKYGLTEIFQWVYVLPILPLLLPPSSKLNKKLLQYLRQWKWIVSISITILAVALMVRVGCIYEAKIYYLSTNFANISASVQSLETSITKNYLNTTLFHLNATGMSSLQSNDDLVIASNAIIIFLALMVIATTHCDYGHMMFVMIFSVLGLLVNIFYWNIQAHGETYVMLLLSGIICIFITWELDLSHRKTFYQYYNAEKSNEVLRESLDTALELIIYNEYKAEEKAIVESQLSQVHIQDKLIPYHIPLEHLSLKRVIGKGGFGEVILADYFGTQVVLKRMHRHKITQQAIEEFTKEILLMCDLRHPNVVQFIGASWNTYSNIGFVLEYVGHGDLYFIIHDKSVAKSWSDPFHRIAVDTARGMCYLHSKSIIHRDLKSTNVLISPTYSAKICDLGASKTMAELKENEKQVGTPLWTAPEVVLGKQFSPKSDVFAFGVILTELITRKLPYHEQKMSAFNIMLSVANDRLRPTLPPWLPAPLRQLIDSCLAQEPENRPNMIDILKDLQKNVMHQLQATDQWTKVKMLVHEKTYRTTSLSFELIQTAKAQAALEEYTKETNLHSSSSDMDNRPNTAQSDANRHDLRSKIETELVSWD